jgi:hypothetical protein
LRQDRLPAERLAAGRSSPDRQARAEPVPVADRESRGVLVWLLAPITLILGAAALKLSAEVTMPLAFAYFLAVLVQPLQVWLQAHLPRWLRWLAVPLTMLTVVAVVALAISLLSMSLEPVISRGPDYAQRFQDWLGGALGWGAPMASSCRRPARSAAVVLVPWRKACRRASTWSVGPRALRC